MPACPGLALCSLSSTFPGWRQLIVKLFEALLRDEALVLLSSQIELQDHLLQLSVGARPLRFVLVGKGHLGTI